MLRRGVGLVWIAVVWRVCGAEKMVIGKVRSLPDFIEFVVAVTRLGNEHCGLGTIYHHSTWHNES